MPNNNIIKKLGGRGKKGRSFEERLDLFARVIVNVGVRIQPGQKLIITAPLEAASLVRLITDHAYAVGAAFVTCLFSDDYCTLSRYKNAHESTFDASEDWLFGGFAKGIEDGAARLAIAGDDPNLLAGQSNALLGRASTARSQAYRPVLELIGASHTNWSICSFATAAWAKAVFPDASQKTAVSKLWDAIFAASRIDNADPIAAWEEHNSAIHRRRDFMNEKNFSALRFVGPGTDLTVGLADNHLWAGGANTAKNGAHHNANIPTEEVFTTPHRGRVNGFVTSTKPLSMQGTLITGIKVWFENGRIVKVHADQGIELLEKRIATDDGAHHLGEVALVPNSSPISASGVLFLSTLFDENAAHHVAIGSSYAKCVKGGKHMAKEDLFALGANQSAIHVDFMIGSGEVNVEGIHSDGRTETLMVKGEWAV